MLLIRKKDQTAAERENDIIKETDKYMQLDDSMVTVKDMSVIKCGVDAQQIEDGAKIIAFSEGIKSLSKDAFYEYNNNSDIIKAIFRQLYFQKFCENQIESDLVKASPRVLPPELKRMKTMKERRDYLMRLYINSRLMGIYLPDSLTDVSADSFPSFLDKIEVSDANPIFRSVDGVLFSKDGKTLIRYPGLGKDRNYNIPEDVTEIAEGAFHNCFIDELVIPGTIKKIPAGVFDGGRYATLRISEGVEELEADCFKNCVIKKMFLPSTLRAIKDGAFSSTSGIEDIECLTEELTLGSCLFRNGRFGDITWWCWKNIPQGTFLNANLGKITIPDGVEVIGRSAFAGCYKAKNITIPSSVTEIQPNAFDEGYSFQSNISLPEHLYCYILRLPVGSTINKKSRLPVLKKICQDDINEAPEIIERQKNDLEKMLGKFNVLQIPKKADSRAEIKIMYELLKRNSVSTENVFSSD